MDDGLKRCPECRDLLVMGHKDGLTTWECPQAHGVGINILEAYGHLQRDELEAIWGGAKDAPLSKLLSPITGRPMAQVTFVADGDTTYGNRSMGAPTITIELDTENYFGWFGFNELKAMPFDTTGRGPSGVGLVGLDQLDNNEKRHRNVFDDVGPDDLGEERGLSGFLGGLARRLGA